MITETKNILKNLLNVEALNHKGRVGEWNVYFII